MRNILGTSAIETTTFIPVPPSKAKGDADYDDRLLRVLKRMALGCDADIREAVTQRNSLIASHVGEERTSIQDLVENFALDHAMAVDPRNAIFVIFDDVLTTGRHFKAMQSVLTNAVPSAHTVGLFLARRAPGS